MNYFDDPNSKHFSFESFADGLDENTFGVINFKGFEAISKVYDFEIMLVSSKKDIDLEDLLQAQAVFTIHRGENDDVQFNGILAEFDQLHEVNDVIFYRARLVPKLWWLSLTHHNQVFLDQSIPDIVEDALRDGGLETADFDIGALSGYEENSYICQYDESHFNFVSRVLERQGIYYYFVQEDDGEILTLTDTKFSHDALKEGAELFYNPASGLEGKHLGEAVGSFTCRQKQLPAEIILKDYNYERPSLDITSRADVDPVGRGVSYLYGEYFATPEEGERLAGIRAEELLCKKQEFFGESTVPYIMPGFTFSLNNHYREDFNQEYLILEVTHEGNQSHLMSGGITTDSGKSQNQSIYHNSFKAIPSETQFRPERITEKPKISGTIHAKVDAEVDGEYAQIDDQGRYHVRLPFDINDEHMAGKGSAPIRMMQPYAGKSRGMQFPLVKDTEVLLTFIEGNPDRPVIAGAVSNPETQGPVNAVNLSESVIQTGGNNRIRMEDKAGSERMVLESPAANSWIRVGTSNDSIVLNGPAVVNVDLNDATFSDQGATTTPPASAGGVFGATPVNDNYTVSITDHLGNVVADDAAVVSTPGIYTYTYESPNASTSTPDTATRRVVVGDVEDYALIAGNDTTGIRIRSAGALWFESESRYGEYHGGAPAPTATSQKTSATDPTQADPNQIGNMLGNFGTSNDTATPPVSFPYSPTNLLPYYADSSGNRTAIDMDTALQHSHVRVASMDTFTTQEGNIYDFGGYWNYNLGNSYEEAHINQCAALNIKHDTTSGTGNVNFPEANLAVMAAVGAFTGIAAGIAAGAAAGKGSAAAAGFGGGVVGAATGLIVSAVSSGWGMADVAEVRTFGDVIEGPGSGTITGLGNKVKSSFVNINPESGEPIDTAASPLDLTQDIDAETGPMHTATTWVTKTLGDTYEYSYGNTLSISHGHTEEHSKGDSYEYSYGGRSEETKFNGAGIMTYHSWSESGEGVEKSYNPQNGQLTNVQYKNRAELFVDAELTLPSTPTFSASLNIASVKTSAELSTGVDIKVAVSAGLSTSVAFNIGFAMEIEGNPSWKLELDDGEMVFKGPYTQFNKEAELKGKIQKLMLREAKMNLKKQGVVMENGEMKVGKNNVDLNANSLTVFS